MADRDPHRTTRPIVVHSGQAGITDPDESMRNGAHTPRNPGQRYAGLSVTVQGHGAPLTVVLADESSARTLLGFLRRLADRGRARIKQ